MSRTKRRFFQRAFKEGVEYNKWLLKFANNAIASYRVEGLPEEIDPRWLAIKLFELGSVAFFYDSDAGEYACMQYSTLGYYDCYGNPTKIRVWNAWTGYNKELNQGEFVIIWDNWLRCCNYRSFINLAYRLWRIDGTIDVNCTAQKTPVIVSCSENNMLSVKNMIAKVDADEPYIPINNKFNMDDVKAIQLNAPFITLDLLEAQQRLYNQGNSMLGIASVISQKKERMITSEVDSANADSLANRRSRTMARDYASQQIKKLFGLDVTWVFDNGDEPDKETDEGFTDWGELKERSLAKSMIER